MSALRLSTLAAVAVVAACVFWVAFDSGTYTESSRTAVGVAVWWAILLLVASGLATVRLSAGGVLALAGLAALAGLSLASAWWAPSAEAAVGEFDRVSMLGGVFLIAALAAQHVSRDRLADALLVGIAAITALALASRLFPAHFGQGALLADLPTTGRRLSYPLGYWNGLAIFCALAVPLALRLAATADHALLRGLAAAVVPPVATVAYFASSRGGFATILAGALALLCLSDRRWDVAVAGGVAAAGAAAAIAAVHSDGALVSPHFQLAAAVRQGRHAAELIAAVCAAVVVATALASAYLTPRLRPRRRLGIAVAVVVAAAAIVAIVAAHPVRRVEAFKRLPSASGGPNLLENHLLSSSGSGRWQFWTAALDEFRAHPLAGGGAGSFEPWWAKHASIAAFVRDAHSLYLQTAAELGVLGLLALVALLAGGIWLAATALRAAPTGARTTPAALAATAFAFAFAASFDWVWQLSAVAIVGLAAIGTLAGRATRPSPAPTGTRVAISVAAALLIAPQTIVFLADARLQDSRLAAARGATAAALSDAAAARRLEPWAASPPLQLALVSEREGRGADARGWLAQAIARDGQDWRLWLIRSRLELEAGDAGAARSALGRARALYPHSPLFGHA